MVAAVLCMVVESSWRTFHASYLEDATLEMRPPGPHQVGSAEPEEKQSQVEAVVKDQRLQAHLAVGAVSVLVFILLSVRGMS